MSVGPSFKRGVQLRRAVLVAPVPIGGEMVLDGSPTILVLSTADWGAAVWTNKQHLALRLARLGYSVTYVNSVGLRMPGLSTRDLRRVMDRVTRRGKSRAGGRPGSGPTPSVSSPLMLPAAWGSPARLVNQLVLPRQMGPWRNAHQERVLWTFSPVTFGLDRLARATVYHCVDLLESFPGVNRGVVHRGEEELARKGVLAIASSRPILQHLHEVGFRRTLLWENVADVDSFALRTPAPSGEGKARKGNLVYAGNLTGEKVDWTLLSSLMERLPSVTLHLAGPIAEGSRTTPNEPELERLMDNPRVRYYGVLNPMELGRLFRRCSVGLIPYRLNSYTTGVFPLKTFEYLAAGLAVVSSPLPALGEAARNSRHIVLASPGDWGQAVQRQDREPSEASLTERLAEAQAHSWSAREAQIRTLVEEMTRGDW